MDFLAGLLGYQKVGWIFSQSKAERDFIMHTGELLQTAAMQVKHGRRIGEENLVFECCEFTIDGIRPSSGRAG